MNVLLWFLYCFLGIFVLAALVALVGLLGVVKVKEPYMNWLVKLLILQVVSTVIAFATKSVDLVISGSTLSEAALTKSVWVWKWDTPPGTLGEQHWYTTARFSKEGKGLTFAADTHYGEFGPVMIRWKSVGPILVPKDPFAQIKFRAERTYTTEGANKEPFNSSLADKREALLVTLDPVLALRGTWTPEGSATPAGILLERTSR